MTILSRRFNQISLLKRAVEKLKTLVFKGTKDEAEYFQMILYQVYFTKLIKDWNLTIFFDCLDLAFVMLGEYDVPHSDMQRLRSLERIVEQGECEDYKKVMEIRRHSKDYSYDEST